MLDSPRSELPPMPTRIAALPVHRGYPVPWFVAWLNPDGTQDRPGDGEADFRVLAPSAVARAYNQNLCWICGGTLGRWRAFVIGPMCSVNRVSAEPPSHVECAQWAAVACPFLSRPHAKRRDSGLPEDAEEAAGTMILRNPGVALLWIVDGGRASYFPFEAPSGGRLFRLGEASRVEWIAEGRAATRAEVETSIASGLPILQAMAEEEGELGVAALAAQVEAARRLLPAETAGG